MGPLNRPLTEDEGMLTLRGMAEAAFAHQGELPDILARVGSVGFGDYYTMPVNDILGMCCVVALHEGNRHAPDPTAASALFAHARAWMLAQPILLTKALLHAHMVGYAAALDDIQRERIVFGAALPMGDRPTTKGDREERPDRAELPRWMREVIDAANRDPDDDKT